ncbi:MAG: hypothetical protein EOP11_20710, partial [Proteobacteria bacterium]
GEEKVNARLLGGAVKDLGLLYRADRVVAQMDYLPFKSGVRSFAIRQKAVFFFAVAGEFSVGCFPGGAEFLLQPGQALRVDANGVEQVLVFEPKKTKSAVLTVEIHW